jgi:penicillin amidase
LRVRRGRAPNATVIGPRPTADRHALLPGGPQMDYSTPQIDHEIGIHRAGFDVPGVVVGCRAPEPAEPLGRLDTLSGWEVTG